MNRNFEKLFFAFLLTSLIGCKSKVEDISEEENQVVQVESIAIESKQEIKSSLAQNAYIEKKNYTIKACLVESAMGQKMSFQKVEVLNTKTKKPETDGSGCVFWNHSLDFDYTGQNRCQVFEKKIKIGRSNHVANIRYSVDMVTDELSDLSKGDGCTYQKKSDKLKAFSNGEKIFMDDIKLFFAGDASLNKSDIKVRSFDTKLSTCLRDKINNLPLSNTAIDIKIEDYENQNKEIVVKNIYTNDQGCFNRNFISDYRQYEYSHWMRKGLFITIKEGPFSGEVSARDFYLNPWEPNRAIFGMDSRDGKPKENPIKKNNKIHIDGVMYVQVGNDIKNFKVNNYLGLTVSKSYQVVLHPRIDKGHLFTSGAARYHKVRDGKFRLKFMLLAPKKAHIEMDERNFSDFKYITGAEKVVEVKDGTINALVNLPIKLTDLPRLATRTLSVFKLEPIKEIGLRDTVVTGFFKAKITWIKTNVIQSKILQTSEKELASKYDKSTHDAVMAKLEKGANLDAYLNNVEDLADLGASKEDVEDMQRHQYKQYIEHLFANITSHTSDKVYGDPEIFTESPKQMFIRHLKKDNPKIKLLTSKDSQLKEEKVFTHIDEKVIESFYDKGIKSNKTTKAFLERLCRKIFPEREYSNRFSKWLDSTRDVDYNRCVGKPERFFEMTKSLHSTKIDKTIPLYSNGFNMTIGSRFITNYSEAQTEYLSKRVGADIGFKIPLGEFFGAGVKLFDVSYTWSDSESTQTSLGDDVSTQKQVIVEKFNIMLDGQFEKCVFLKGKKYLPADYMKTASLGMGMGMAMAYGMEEYMERLPHDFYFCTRPKAKKLQEAWYYIQSYVPSATLLRDSYGPTEIKLIKVIRGQKNFKEFETVFRDKTKTYLIEENYAEDTPDIKLYQNWGHLINIEEAPDITNSLLIENIEGSFPGTIL